MFKLDKKEMMIQTLGKFVDMTSKELPDDVMAKLKELRVQETKPLAKAIYDVMFENMDKAKKLSRPTCQDTGVIQY